MAEEIVVLTAFVISLSIMAIFIISLFRRTKNRIRPLLEDLGIGKRWVVVSSRITFSHQGEKMTIDINPMQLDDSFGSTVELTIPCKTDFEFHLERKDTIDNFYSDSPHKDVIRFLSISSDFKSLVSKLFKMGVWRITLEKNRLKVGFEYSPSSGKAVSELPANILRLRSLILGTLANLSPSFVPRVSRLPLILCYVLPIVIIVGFFAMSIFLDYKSKCDFDVLNSRNLLTTTAKISLPYLALYLVVSYFITSKYANFHLKFFFANLIAIIWFFASMVLVQSLNGYLDKSLPTLKEYDILAKWGGEGNSYYVIIGKPNGGQSKIFFLYGPRVSIDIDEYSKVNPGLSKIKIMVKEGALKIPWIYGYVIYYDEVSKAPVYDYYYIGYKKYRHGDYDGAIWIFTEGIRNTGDNAVLYYARGVVYQKKGELRSALSDFKKACELGLEKACQAHK